MIFYQASLQQIFSFLDSSSLGLDEKEVSLSETATAPMDPPKNPSETDFQVCPELVVFQIPPPVEAK